MKHGDEGYIIMKPPKDFNNFDFSFKFRSVHDDGLIVYSANVEQDQALSIGLLNGQIHVVLVPSRGSSVAVDTSRAGFADGFWHHVTVSLKKKKLVLVFDDNVEEKIEVDLRQKPKIKTTQMYFGGVPVAYPIVSDNVLTTKRFKGCLADVSIDTKFQDFAAGPPESRVNVGLDQCLIPNLAPNPLPTVVVPTSQPSTGEDDVNAMLGDIDPKLIGDDDDDENSPSSSSDTTSTNRILLNLTNVVDAPERGGDSSSSSSFPSSAVSPSSTKNASASAGKPGLTSSLVENNPFVVINEGTSSVNSSSSSSVGEPGESGERGSSVTDLISGPPIKAPTNVGVADGGAEGEAAVSWEYIVDSGEIVTGYRVSYVLDDGIGDPGGISSSQWSEVDVGGGFRSTLIRNLVAGSAYIFRVSAINDFGSGPWSRLVTWRLMGGVEGGVKC